MQFGTLLLLNFIHPGNYGSKLIDLLLNNANQMAMLLFTRCVSVCTLKELPRIPNTDRTMDLI